MILKIFTVYDSKAEAYFRPFYEQTKGSAIRAFIDTCNDIEHTFFRHAEDYTLFYLGEYDDQNASFNLPITPEPIGKAIEFKKVQDLIGPDEKEKMQMLKMSKSTAKLVGVKK